MQLFFNPATNVVFGSDEVQQDTSLRMIGVDQIPDLIANGATVDSSANYAEAGPLASGEDPAASDAASQSESDTSSSANLASQDADSAAIAENSKDGSEAGNVGAAGAALDSSGSDAIARTASGTDVDYHPDDPRPKIMGLLAVARAHLATVEADVCRNASAALDEIEALLGMEK